MMLDREFLREIMGPYVVKIVAGFLILAAGLSIAFGHSVAYICIALGRADLAGLIIAILVVPENLYLHAATAGVIVAGLGYILVYRGFQEGVLWLKEGG